MAKTIKLKAVKNYTRAGEVSITKSLQDRGYTRFPGSFVTLYPHREPDGRYRTGLDPDALYISQMSPEEQKIEIAIVKDLANKVKERLGKNFDFGPRSDFYTKMNDSKINTPERAPISRLGEEATLNIEEDLDALIAYAYLRVHPLVAPSLESITTNAKYSNALFYINDTESEDEIIYKRKSLINKAKALVDTLSLSKRRKIARQLGLPVRENTKEATVYKLLDDYLDEASTNKFSENLALFNKFANMRDDLLATRDLIKRAVEYGAIRKSGSTYKRGEESLGTNFEAVVDYLLDPKNSEMLISIQEEVKLKDNIVA